MRKLVECVPNFSEGRDRAVIDAIADAIRATAGCTLLDVDPGASTNRTVYTLVGEPELIWAFLGSGRLATPIGMHRPDLVVHGHAHHGTQAGAIGEVPVRNVAVHVTSEDFTHLEL